MFIAFSVKYPNKCFFLNEKYFGIATKSQVSYRHEYEKEI